MGLAVPADRRDGTRQSLMRAPEEQIHNRIDHLHHLYAGPLEKLAAYFVSLRTLTYGRMSEGEPFDGVAADASVSLRYVRPADIVAQLQKNTRRALVGAFRQHDFVACAKRGNNRFGAQLD